MGFNMFEVFVIAWAGVLLWLFYELATALKRSNPYRMAEYSHYNDDFGGSQPECIVCANNGVYDHLNIKSGAINYVCSKHLYMPASKANSLAKVSALTNMSDLYVLEGKNSEVYGRSPALDALYEQGAGDEYIERVKAQLCGPMGRAEV